MKMKYFFIFLLLYPSIGFTGFIGIGKKEFEQHYKSQRAQNWCWASSAEMVLSYQGINLPQETIVERIKGFRVDATGNPMEMIKSVNTVLRDEQNRRVVVSGQYVTGAPLTTVLYNHLKQKKPVILTYQSGPWFGHAVVLTGMDAIVNNNNIDITKLYIFDPFSYRQVTDWRGYRLEHDSNLIYREYRPRETPLGIEIEAGLITGVIFVDGSVVNIN